MINEVVNEAVEEIATESFAEAKTEEKTNMYGATFAVDKALTIGAGYYKTEKEGDSDDETAKYLHVGYNLGPVTAILAGTRVENVGYAAAKDVDVITARLSTKF